MTKRNASALLVLIFGAMLVLTACGDPTPTGIPAAVGTTKPATLVAAQTLSTPGTATTQTTTGTELSYNDASSYKLSLNKPAKRVVCLNFDCLDWLAEVGMLPIGVGKEMAAYTALPYLFGNKASQIPTVGGSVFEPNLEEITKAKPDLIIGYAHFHENIREPLKAVAPVLVSEATSLEDAYASFQGFARLVGKSAQADSAIKKFKERYEAYTTKALKDKAVMITYGDGTSFVVRSEKSLVCQMFRELSKCPWTATAKDAQGGTPYSLEEVLKTDPDAIFVFTLPDKPKVSLQLKDNPLWKELKAVKNVQAFDIDASLIECSGTRTLNELMDQTMPKLYPQVFPKALP